MSPYELAERELRLALQFITQAMGANHIAVQLIVAAGRRYGHLDEQGSISSPGSLVS